LPVACAITWTLVEPPHVAAVVADRGSQAGPTLVLRAGLAAALDAADIPATAGRSSTAPIRPAAESPSAADAFRILTTKAAAAAEPWLPTCAALWLAGVIAAAVRLVVGWALTRRLVATAAPLPDASWRARLIRWTTALGIAAPIRLLASARVDVPIVVGWLRPVVIWPVAAVTGMPPEQIDAILAHELAHVRRHDVLVNLVQSVIEAVFFHHPAAWWISAQVRAEREHCADELAIRALAAGQAGSRLSYATALLSLEERRQAILAAAANGGSLGDRIRRLAGIEQSSGHPARLAAAVVVLVAVAVTLAAPPGSASRQAMAADVQSPGQTDKPALADDLPADTSSITSLTPEQARLVVGEALPACVLQRHPEKSARERATMLAEILANRETAEVYESWAILRLNGLTTLDAETAEVLANFKGILDLDGLPALDPEAARHLAGGNCKWLRLHGLKTLSPETARELVKSRLEGRAIFLPQLDTLDVATAKVLATFKGQELILRGLVAIDVDVAKALAEYRGRLHLGLTTLDAETVEALAAAGFRERLSLDGLATLDADTAQALAHYKGSLRLPNLKKISPKTLAALLEKEDVQLPLIETLELIPEPDGSPTEDFVIPDGSSRRSAPAPAAAAPAAARGRIKGRFVYKGGLLPPVDPRLPALIGGPAPIGEPQPLGEDFVVDPATRGLANVVVFLRDKDLEVDPRVAAAARAKPATLDARNMHFTPRVVVVQPGQDLPLTNGDPVGHNFNIARSRNPGVNALIPALGKDRVRFAAEEPLPASVIDNIYPWMKAWVLVRPNPYAAVTKPDGSFEIPDVPAGEVELQLWHERFGRLAGAATARGEADDKGRLRVRVEPGVIDLWATSGSIDRSKKGTQLVCSTPRSDRHGSPRPASAGCSAARWNHEGETLPATTSGQGAQTRSCGFPWVALA
jgi:beta-lactamase regulating signal transducer with metallopeptidase domain